MEKEDNKLVKDMQQKSGLKGINESNQYIEEK